MITPFWVGGRNLCLHYVDGVQYEHVTWRLLPLLEWLANDWDCILHEQRYPMRNEAGHAGHPFIQASLLCLLTSNLCLLCSFQATPHP